MLFAVSDSPFVVMAFLPYKGLLLMLLQRAHLNTREINGMRIMAESRLKGGRRKWGRNLLFRGLSSQFAFYEPGLSQMAQHLRAETLRFGAVITSQTFLLWAPFSSRDWFCLQGVFSPPWHDSRGTCLTWRGFWEGWKRRYLACIRGGRACDSTLAES